jgi:hypothetical protein
MPYHHNLAAYLDGTGLRGGRRRYGEPGTSKSD